MFPAFGRQLAVMPFTPVSGTGALMERRPANVSAAAWQPCLTGIGRRLLPVIFPAPEGFPGVGARTLVSGARQFHFYSSPIDKVLIWVKTCFNRLGSIGMEVRREP